MTQNDIRDRLLELARARLKARFGAFEQFRFTVDSLPAGAAIMARAALMPAPWTVGLSLGLDEAARQIDAHLLRLIDEWAQHEAPARQIPVLEGLQPLAAEPQAAPVVADSASNAPAWTVTKPQRYSGYAAPLHRFLAAAHREGKPRPTARDVLEAWRSERPAGIAKVLADGFDYFDANGDEKAADLEAIRKAIGRMTSAR